MPYSDFGKVASCLDSKRLNKQIAECDQLIELHLGLKNNSYKNHPAFKMWSGHVEALKFYRNCMLSEWIRREFNNKRNYFEISKSDLKMPEFIYDKRVINSHRSNLVRKAPEHYLQFGWKDFGIEGYYWPCEVKGAKTKRINKQWLDLFKKTTKNTY